jgi:hypothetical protein
MKTYEVDVTAQALRVMKVRAASAREALELASLRIRGRSGPWTIDFPGVEDEHFTVSLDGEILGPNSEGDFSEYMTYDDEEQQDDDDEDA